MSGFRSVAALLAALVLFFSVACAEDQGLQVEEIDIPLEEIMPVALTEDEPETESKEVFTPSWGSPWKEDIASSYWTTPMDITDEETVWNMLMEPITVIDLGVKNKSKSQQTKMNLYIYREPDKNSKIVGELTNLSQGVRVIRHLDSGWSLVECYSSSFANYPKTKISAWNILVSGYIESKYLKEVQPTDQIALVVDKLTQRVYVFSEGKMLCELLCSTGLVQKNIKGKYQPYNETRSGEFLVINMTGSLTSDNLVCAYAMRFNGGDEIHEVPHVVEKDKTWSYDKAGAEKYLGAKHSHGCIRVQRKTTPEGYNMKWIYRKISDNDLCGKVKIIVWEDWQGRQIDTPSPDTVLYYNANNKGTYYHRADHCNSAKAGTVFSPFLYSQLDEAPFSGLKACPFCVPVRRESDIRKINETYAPGGDHEEMLNSLRKGYYEYLAKD